MINVCPQLDVLDISGNASYVTMDFVKDTLSSIENRERLKKIQMHVRPERREIRKYVYKLRGSSKIT